MIDRRDFIGAAAGASASLRAATASSPNLLIVMTDQQRFSALS